MFSSQSAELSLNRPVASIDAVKGDQVNSKFLVGTSSARISEDNHLLVLKFHSDANHLGIDGRLSHPTGPVELIKTSPSDSSHVLTAAENDSGAATLWKIPSEIIDRMSSDDDYGSVEDDDEYYDRDPSTNSGADTDEVKSMEELATLQTSDGTSSKVSDIAWRGPSWDEDPSAASMGDVATLNADGTLKQWDINFGSAESTRNCSVSSLGLPPKMAWDPHQSDITAISTGNIVQLVDWREAPRIHSSTGHPHHRYGITDLDYNPNKPNHLVTSGKDGLLKFWDLRNTGSGHYDASDGEDTTKKKKQRPLLVARGGHRHWSTRVLYNPFHDQLVLSSGTDALVNLWRISTISSAPLLTLDDEPAQPKPSSKPQDDEGPNVRVSRFEHMDSVNAIAWGAADAWIYMSASYDGKVVVNHVPSTEKYKILL